MSIQFCPKCQNLLIPETHQNKLYMVCPKCQITISPDKNEPIEPEKFSQKVIGKGVAEKIHEGHDFKCPRCGNTNCKLTDLGCMIGDEDWVYLLECTKCGYAERVGEWC